MEFKEYELSELGEIVGGSTPSTKDEENYGGRISWITPKDLTNLKGRYINKGERNITEKGFKEASTKMLPKNSVLFSSRAPIGYIAINNKNEVCTNQGFKSIVPNEKIDYMFLYYLLKYNKGNIEQLGSGTTFKEVSGSVMKSVKVKIPENKTDQIKIATILSKIDDKIELNNKINDNLYDQAVAIYNNKFKFVENPDGCIGDYIIPKRGKNLLSREAINGDIPVVAGGLEPATYHNISNTKVPVITISASGANAGYVNLWNIPVWSSDSSYIDNDVTDNVYFWYITLKTRQKEIFDAQTGSAQPHIYPQHIAELPINKLNMNDVVSYEKEVTPFFEMIGENKKQNKYLEQLRDTLLPKLINGEIDLDKIEI